MVGSWLLASWLLMLEARNLLSLSVCSPMSDINFNELSVQVPCVDSKNATLQQLPLCKVYIVCRRSDWRAHKSDCSAVALGDDIFDYEGAGWRGLVVWSYIRI